MSKYLLMQGKIKKGRLENVNQPSQLFFTGFHPANQTVLPMRTPVHLPGIVAAPVR
jgi:hypothetical protein